MSHKQNIELKHACTRITVKTQVISDIKRTVGKKGKLFICDGNVIGKMTVARMGGWYGRVGKTPPCAILSSHLMNSERKREFN
jgi:hypothetical protein